MDEQVEAYCGLLKELREFTRISARDIECYCGISSSSLYQIEKGGNLRLASYLRLLALYLAACGYVFRHQALTESLEEAIRKGENIRLTVEPARKSCKTGRAGMLLEKLPSGKR